MIKNINISNFKSFIKKDIPLARLTLLSGLNSSGKSTVIQALRMYHLACQGVSPLLAGHGNVNELRSKFVGPNEKICISLEFANQINSSLQLGEQDIQPPNFGAEIIYIGADRLGPQPNLPTEQAFNVSPHVGSKGEYVLDFISRLSEQNYILPDGLLHPNSQSKTFSQVLQDWLSEITPGVRFSYQRNTQADISHAEIDNYRPTNVGFGLSYTLPIIAAVLGSVAKPLNSEDNASWVQTWEVSKASKGMLVMVENPEAHLHPKGQTAMGKLLALCAQQGAQVVVETHSEHVMDGIRIAIKQGQIAAADVKFHYFTKDEQGKTKLTSPMIDENAKLDSWPEGFFDQTLKNRALLARRN
ncbi:hypothetical protein AKN94_01080 [Thiopseudomonas alkaliphila]|uniref:AAA family ATPase n=1 Tax=Thiopseudomonas alkaliphila TaxID=1697053 RepID=UPI00069D5AB5|nr:DUF3696 domain-containing protein [Thiopseudomonas alkaliphila]AKX46118.1 hypothetical protein AKN94_01080 [Thiopseudomonas alkaliphila]AKX56114.1 hypothetical protein AKN90_10655 [Thiopseudomonas alkaliphila]